MNHDFDIDRFLEQPLFAHLATASSDGPRESPVWFLWENGALWIVGSHRDSFPHRIRADPRCALGIVEFDLGKGVLRHLGIRGVGAIESLDPQRLRRLLAKYIGPDSSKWNAEFRASVIDKLDLMVRIEPRSIVARDQSYFSDASPLRTGHTKPRSG